MQIYHLVNLSFFISLYHLAIQYVHMSVEIIYETISCNSFYNVLCKWNDLQCFIGNLKWFLHNYESCTSLLLLSQNYIYGNDTSIYRNMKTFSNDDNAFLNNFTYTLWPHQCFLAIACESNIATGKNLYPKIIISKHWSQTMEKCFCCCSSNGKCQVGISCCNHVMSVMWKLLNESL